VNSKPNTAEASAIKGVEYYQMMQCEDGHWAGDYGGPMFLMPGLIAVLYITKAPFAEWKKKAMVTYLKNHQQSDGGWGTHIECASTMFGTVLSYVSLRLLGESPNQEYMKAAQNFMYHHGGALYAPSWSKFWLAVLGVYDWKGINSIPVELWCLPRWSPFHPGRMWCHSRMVYLPMGYLYCKRFCADVASDPLLQSLRQELYTEPYHLIDWDAHRQAVADIDNYSPLNPFLKVAQDALSWYEYFLPYIPFASHFRQKGLEFTAKYMHAEDIQTNYIDIGPVNKSFNMLVAWLESGKDTTSEPYLRHLARVEDYLWVSEDGMKMQGYNGSQCWDTSFFVQALVEGGIADRFPECSQKIYSYLKRTQIPCDEDDNEYFFRQISKGGWPFSTAAHGWPISDCTSEGLKGVLALHKVVLPSKELLIRPEDRIPDASLQDAVNVIFSLHNKDGGWATYENNRGYGWYELLNPSEVFGDIMIDYSYVECTSACVTALKHFHEVYPGHRTQEVLSAMRKGGEFIKTIQRHDGSWYGSWGNCFTYGTWFGLECLAALGETLKTSEAMRNAEAFLLSKQNPNGGWGESYVSCVDKAYAKDGTGPGLGEGGSGVVQTAWALLGLLAAGSTDRAAIERGVRFLMKRQLANGDWEQEGITGVFNRSCGITYSAYRNVFPIWALLRYSKAYPNILQQIVRA
jgi:squalene/oxidosqualene cyclase-like protein